MLAQERLCCLGKLRKKILVCEGCILKQRQENYFLIPERTGRGNANLHGTLLLEDGLRNGVLGGRSGCFFEARRAHLDASGGSRKPRPLEIGIFADFVCRVIMASQEGALASQCRALVADGAGFHIFKRYHTSMEHAISLIFQLAILLFSVVLHEISHGYAALYLGDRTALFAGRLTINPLKHLDPMGSVVVPVLSSLAGMPFGWAKPVPYNPYNLRNQKWGSAMVGVAGPVANIFIALVFGLLVRFLPNAAGIIPGSLFINFLDIASLVVLTNLFLACFNLLPIPPLDGSKLLFAFLPYRYRGVEWFLDQYGLFVLFFLLFVVGGSLLSPLIQWLVRWAFYLITGSFPF